jgi:uncharacterized protein YdeI (YjbR/CyaY-like superfamily)
MLPTERFAKVEIASLDDLRRWLDHHGGQHDSVWLVRYRASVPDRFVNRLDVIDVLLEYGWVDGLARKLDDVRTMQLISPRRQQAWAQSYKDRAAKLITAGRMTPAGLASIAASKAQGLWDAYADIDALIVPDDLVLALAAHPVAAAYFAKTPPSYRRSVLRWIAQAKTPGTREKRISTTLRFSAEHQRIPQM